MGALWESVTSWTNLVEATRRAALGKKSRPDVAAFCCDLEPNLAQLRRELRNEIYAPGAYRVFWICEPKRRQISAAPFRDHVTHHALTQVLEPIFERRFNRDSYACRLGKGSHAALATVRRAAGALPYALRGDIRKYFASMDHEILESELGRVIKCRPTLALAAGSFEALTRRSRWTGTSRMTTFSRRVTGGEGSPWATKPRSSLPMST